MKVFLYTFVCILFLLGILTFLLLYFHCKKWPVVFFLKNNSTIAVSVQQSIQDTLLDKITIEAGAILSFKVGPTIINKRTTLPIQRDQVQDVSFFINAADSNNITVALDPGNLPSDYRVDVVTAPGFYAIHKNVGKVLTFNNSWYTITLPTGIHKI
jgi:hypothetical protein